VVKGSEVSDCYWATSSEKVHIYSGLIEDIADSGVQRELVDVWCELNDTILNEVEYKKIDTDVNMSMVDVYDIDNRFNTYKILEIEVENFQSYAKEKIVYDDYKGLCAVISNPMNEGGKSTLTRINTFLLYAKAYSTGEKFIELFNQANDARKMSLVGKIRMNDFMFIIDRKFTRSKSDNVKHFLTFKKYDLKGNELKDLTGEKPQDTQNTINRYFGNFTDFYNTQSINSDNLKSAVYSTSSEKNTILSSHLGLDILTEKEKKCRSLYEVWKKTAIIKQKDIGAVKNTIDQYEIDLKELEKRKIEIDKKHIELVKEKTDIEDTIAKKQTYMEAVDNINIDDVEKQLVTKEQELDNLKKEGVDLKSRLEQIVNPKIDKEVKTKEKVKIQNDLNNLQISLGTSNAEIKDLNNKLEISKEVIKCERCGKEFKETQLNIDKLNKSLSNAQTENSKLLQKITAHTNSINDININIEKQNNYNDRSNQMNIEIEIKRNSYKTSNDDIVKIKATIKKFYEQEELVLKNKLIQNEIGDLQLTLATLSSEIGKLEGELKFIDTKHKSTSVLLSTDRTTYSKMQSEVDTDRMYKLYIKLMGRNGIAKLIINKSVQGINNLLKEFLYDTVSFEVKLEQTDKNDHEFFFYETVGGRKVKRRLATCSGWQLLAPCLSIVFVLSRMSALPKSTFIYLDEITGSASVDNYENIKTIINEGATFYDNIFLISHNQEIQEWADTILGIEKVDGISRII